MNNVNRLASAAASTLVLIAGGAFAESPPEAVSQKREGRVISSPAAQAKASPFIKARAVTDSDLQRIVGRQDISQAVIAHNTGNVSNNTIGDNSNTGTITFDGQSFQGLHGLSVLSANTGNNVSINASMNVNVAIRQ